MELNQVSFDVSVLNQAIKEYNKGKGRLSKLDSIAPDLTINPSVENSYRITLPGTSQVCKITQYADKFMAQWMGSPCQSGMVDFVLAVIWSSNLLLQCKEQGL